jgi:hypothetical protein
MMMVIDSEELGALLKHLDALRQALVAHVEQFGGVHCHPEECPDLATCDEHKVAAMVDAALRLDVTRKDLTRRLREMGFER